MEVRQAKMNGYETIKQLAKKIGWRIPDLLVLARQNDPFFAGSKTSRAMAEWFADLWHKFGYTSGVHLRRVHYQLVSQEDPRKHDGTPYENTINDWNYLCLAAKYARYLRLVDPTAFVDRRNPKPHLYRWYGEGPQKPGWSYNFPEWYLPKISIDLAAELDWALPYYQLRGYDYDEALQPYHLEVWVEKSTMDDVLVPLCQEYRVNLVTGLGFMSITSVIELLKRVSEANRPCLIFYISDFDPAGDGMPTAVARQIEYWRSVYLPEADIKLDPIVLTREQVERYKLPRIPVKDSDRRKGNFERRYGEGAVELDALEALCPGELAEIVEKTILQYRDNDLEKAYYDAWSEANEELATWWEKTVEPYRQNVKKLREQVASIVQKYQRQIEALNQEMAKELAPYQEEAETLRQAIQNAIASIEPVLPKPPKARVEANQRDWLFDSSRDYFGQLAVYKARKENGGR